MDIDDMCIAHVNLARGFRGGERQTQLLVQGLARRGFHQKLIARRGEPLAQFCLNVDGLEIVTVPNNIFSAVSALDEIGLVHIHEGRAIQAGYLNKKLRGNPYLVTRRVQKGPGHNPVTRTMYRNAAAVVTLSQAISRSMARLDPGIECDVIPDSTEKLKTDPEMIGRLRAGFGDGFIVGHVGELDDSHKGQRQIIAAARRTLGRFPEVKYVMVGSGRDEELLKQETHELPNVFYAGQVANVGDYLAAFDAFLYPSRHEGLGSTLLDALSFGLPIVATKIGGIPELLDDGLNGFLCKLDDPDELAEAVLELYRNPELRKRISRVNARKAAQYSPDEMIARYIKVYDRLIKEQGLETAVI